MVGVRVWALRLSVAGLILSVGGMWSASPASRDDMPPYERYSQCSAFTSVRGDLDRNVADRLSWLFEHQAAREFIAAGMADQFSAVQEAGAERAKALNELTTLIESESDFAASPKYAELLRKCTDALQVISNDQQ